MGLPQIDFRVPEATRFKSALVGKFGPIQDRFGALQDRFGAVPALRSTGALAWPYKIAVVAVMALVACGTLVTFGSAGAETPSSAQAAALPGSDEASPIIEGQVLPPSTGLLNSADLLATLNLTDYSPGTTSLSDDDEDNDDSDEEKDEDAKSDAAKKLAAANTSNSTNSTTSSPTTAPTSKPTTSAPSEQPTTNSPPPPAEPVEGPKHQAWEDRKEAYEDCRGEARNGVEFGLCELKNPGSEPSYTS